MFSATAQSVRWCSMNLPIHRPATLRSRFFASVFAAYGRSAPYRRRHTIIENVTPPSHRPRLPLLPRTTLIQPLKVLSYHTLRLTPAFTVLRTFSTRSTFFDDQSKQGNVRDPPREEDHSDEAKEPDSAKASSQKSGPSGEDQSEKKEQRKEPPPPPPPHGDKTPWQVFTETLKTEFKASKEWNESTKALASSAHQFTENESMKFAKAAYTTASSTATSATSSALKNTGKVLGKGAAWTWETPVVKGVRAGVSATGKGLDKVTKPVRDTAAFKSVKEVIDDGSSSRYGGWVEKEERRKQREWREAQGDNSLRKPTEKFEEDPK